MSTSGMIDLRSDTVTRPSPEMRRAMAEAEVGDDILEGDPTTRRLEETVARMCGKDCPMFALTSKEVNECARDAKKAAEKRKRVEALAGFFEYAKEQEWVRVNLAVGLVKKKAPKVEKKAPVPKKQEVILLSDEGRQKVKDEIQELFREKERVTAEVAAAREEGDLSENAGYHDARERLALIDAQLREKDALLARATSVDE